MGTIKFLWVLVIFVLLQVKVRARSDTFVCRTVPVELVHVTL